MGFEDMLCEGSFRINLFKLAHITSLVCLLQQIEFFETLFMLCLGFEDINSRLIESDNTFMEDIVLLPVLFDFVSIHDNIIDKSANVVLDDVHPGLLACNFGSALQFTKSVLKFLQKVPFDFLGHEGWEFR